MIDSAPIFSVYAVCVTGLPGDMFTRGGIKPSFTSVSRVTGVNEANHRRRGGGRAKAMKTAAVVSDDRHPQIRRYGERK